MKPIRAVLLSASAALTVAIAWLAVGSQTWRAARLKPADVPRHEYSFLPNWLQPR